MTDFTYNPGDDIGDPFGIRGHDPIIPINPSDEPGYVVPGSKRTWIPPQDAVVGDPGIPGTPDQIKREFNEGWNSHARSINKVAKDSYFIFTVKTDVKGCVVAIDRIGQDDKVNFSHSIISDLSGIHVFEDGAIVHTFSDKQSIESRLRVYNQDDKIIYVCTTGKETDVYTSAIPPSKWDDLYIYGLLYAGLDIIETHEYQDGIVQFGAA